MQIRLAQDFITSQLKDTKTHVKRKISFIYLTSLKFTRDSNEFRSLLLSKNHPPTQSNKPKSFKRGDKNHLAGKVRIHCSWKIQEQPNQTCKPPVYNIHVTTFVFAHKTPRLRDSFLKGSTSQEHDGNDDFHVSPHVPSLPPPPFFDRVQRPTPRCIERCIDQHRSGDVRSAVMWRWIWLPAKAVFVDKCPLNREQVSLFTLCFLCRAFPFTSRYSVAHWKSVTNTRIGGRRGRKGLRDRLIDTRSE